LQVSQSNDYIVTATNSYLKDGKCMQTIIDKLLNNNIFILFVIISIGKLIEQIKIRGFSLGIASIFVIAAVFGHFNLIVPQDFQYYGLAIFVYCIGIESGPQFFSLFGKKAGGWFSISLLHIFLSIATISILAFFLNSTQSSGTLTGLYAGSLTSTPAMASVFEHTKDKSVTAAFGIIYPLSLLGNIYLIPLLPLIFRQNIPQIIENFMQTVSNNSTKRALKIFRITNTNLINQKAEILNDFAQDNIVFTRYIEQGVNQLFDGEILLHADSSVAAVGSESALEKLSTLIGPAKDPDTARDTGTLLIRKIILSNADSAGKTLNELNFEHRFNIRITRIIRGSVEMSPQLAGQLQLGDKIMAIGNAEDIALLTKTAGDDTEEIFKTQFAPISIGVALGIVAGTIPLPFLKTTLGMTGGILILSMFLGYKVKFMKILWQIPQQTNTFLKQLGLYIFFAALGSNSGKELLNIFDSPDSLNFIITGIVLCFLPVILTYIISIKFMHKNPLEVLGILAGTVSNSSVIVTLNEKFKTDIPNPAFAFAYPLGMILSIISAEAMFAILKLII